MGQHYTLNTVETAAWCTKCGRETPHHVAERRLQYCKVCMDKPKEAPAPRPEPQPKLF
jgi:hypothetical protein